MHTVMDTIGQGGSDASGALAAGVDAGSKKVPRGPFHRVPCRLHSFRRCTLARRIVWGAEIGDIIEHPCPCTVTFGRDPSGGWIEKTMDAGTLGVVKRRWRHRNSDGSLENLYEVEYAAPWGPTVHHEQEFQVTAWRVDSKKV